MVASNKKNESMTIDICDEFGDELRHGRLVVMPMSRLLLEVPFKIDKFRFYPANSIDLRLLNIAKPVCVEDFFISDDLAVIEGEAIAKFASCLSGAKTEIFETSASVAFVTEQDLTMANGTHDDVLQCVAVLSQEAERAIDQIRLDFCRFDLPETLPGVAGTWAGSEAYACAVLFDSSSKRGHIIAGEALLHSVVSKGLGLELNAVQFCSTHKLPSSDDGEVGGVVQHAMRLFSDVMNANTNTSKFLRAMTLLEFLGSPFKYQKFQESKKGVIAHVARNFDDYQRLLQRFKQFSDLKCETTNAQLGYRTLLVHHDRFLEEVIHSHAERRSLFLELQGYAHAVISDLVCRKHSKWDEVVKYRSDRRSKMLSEAKERKCR